jgi:hypothetical protein
VTDEQRAELAELDANIAQGRELMRQGYPVSMQLLMTIALRDDLEREANGCTAKI